ncbi:MAG: helix-turn-helix domain-containing protein [Bacillota bacterium]|nr:helix-turn-helix domain-containing protein [Bacillota bacterium]
MELVASLQQIGFSEYEAKVYLALLANPGITGYEVGRHSGVPRAKVYEVLESLVRRGVALVETSDGKQLYQPLEHELLLSRHREGVLSLLGDLGPRLGRISVLGREPRVLILRDRAGVMDRCRHMCADARAQLLVSGWPDELTDLVPTLLATEKRGATCHVLSYGPLDAALSRLVVHAVTPLQHIQVAALGRWMIVSADLEQCLMVQIAAADRVLGLWTDFAGFVSLVAQAIQHDLYLMVVADALGEQAMELVPPAARRLLEGLWTWAPAVSPPVALPTGTPDVESIFDGIRERLAADPALAGEIRGGYEFRLKGEDEHTRHVDLRGGRLDVGKGAIDKPDLTVTMSSADFRALAMGVLPPGAIYVPGRIAVSGDVRLAARLRQLLGV